MPISLLWYFIPWLVLACIAFYWRRVAGIVFVATSGIALLFTGSEKRYDEPIAYEVIGMGQSRTLRLTNNHGDQFTGGSAALAERLQQTHPPTVRVVMEATYDFGSLRAYHVTQIDGSPP